MNIMKKTYIIPNTSLEQVDVDQMIAGSIKSVNDNIDIGYGGIDNNGTLNPDAKESSWDIWSD
jgi:hypothetical protein